MGCAKATIDPVDEKKQGKLLLSRRLEANMALELRAKYKKTHPDLFVQQVVFGLVVLSFVVFSWCAAKRWQANFAIKSLDCA